MSAPSPRLDAAAAQLQRGRSLEDALADAAYQATLATAVRVNARKRRGQAEGEALRGALAARYCAQLANAEYLEIGTARDGDALRLAILFHDVVYDPRRSDNEAVSADVAKRELAALGVGTALIDRVVHLVLASHTWCLVSCLFDMGG